MFDHQRLDPRSKLAFTLVVIGLSIALPRFRPLAAITGVVVLVVASGTDPGLRRWLGFVRPLKVLIPVLFVLNLVFYPGGAVIWQAPIVPVSVSVGGIETSGLIVFRLVLIAGVAAWFAMSTAAEAFEVALARLGVPWTLAFILSLTLRLIPEMRSRYQTVEDAQRARGLALEGGPIRRARARIPTLIPFFVTVIEFGYELTDALVVRGLGASERRTSVVSVEHSRVDYGFYLLSIALLLGMLVLFG